MDMRFGTQDVRVLCRLGALETGRIKLKWIFM
jgi:hypothetical protein